MMDCVFLRCIPIFFAGWMAEFYRSKKEERSCLPHGRHDSATLHGGTLFRNPSRTAYFAPESVAHVTPEYL
ncbi:MAG: hypothetical protein U0T76_02430 [Saprospiraceae bacterium]